MIKGIIYFAILMVFFFWAYSKSRNAVLERHEKNYEKKISKFPWFAQYIKEKGYTAKMLSGGVIEDKITSAGLACFGIGYVGGWLLNKIIQFVINIILGIGGLSMSNAFEYFLYENTGSLLALIIAIIVTKKIWHKAVAKNEKIDIGGECADCGCPMALVKLKEQNIVENVREERKTTTTRRTQSADSYGGGAIGAMFAAAGSSSSTSTTVTKYYDGKTVYEYNCRSCGHSYQKESQFTGYTKRPDETLYEYDPPREVGTLSVSSEASGKKKVVVAACILLVVGTLINWAYADEKADKRPQKGPKTNQPMLVSKEKTIYSEPDKNAATLGQIPVATIVTIAGKKTNDFWLVSYQGTEGWIENGYLKLLSDDLTVKVRKKQSVHLYDEPYESTWNEKPTLVGSETLTLTHESKVVTDSSGYDIRWIKVIRDYNGKEGWLDLAEFGKLE